MKRYKMETKWSIKHIADLIRESKNVVAFTGAGVSTESGLPDFRSNQGLWNGQDPMTIAHKSAIENNPKALAEFYADRVHDINTHAPNKAHHILAEWEQKGILKGIATQNIDGYHGKAGNKAVWEVHGNMDLYCSFCLTKYDHESYVKGQHFCTAPSQYYPDEPCEAVIRPNVVLFGEMLPNEVFYQASKSFQSADLCIILGTSCSVYPAANLPFETIQHGGKVVIINHSDTEMDMHADYIINDLSISQALEKINKLI